MAPKSEQLQIRVTAEQKRALKRLAREAGVDVSSWVLGHVLPSEPDRFQVLTERLGSPTNRRHALAELADWLRALPRGGFGRAVARAPAAALDADTRTYLAGAIELAAAKRGFHPPAWTRDVPAGEAPQFGSGLRALRLHLLTRSPVPLRARNVFVDSSLDDRV
jgi:hypothetical protein